MRSGGHAEASICAFSCGHGTSGVKAAISHHHRTSSRPGEPGRSGHRSVARDADKLETLLQAVEYAAQGFDTAPWQETSTEALRTDVGQQLAQAISATGPGNWWQAFAASYHELRASAKGRTRQTGSRQADPDRPAGEDS